VDCSATTTGALVDDARRRSGSGISAGLGAVFGLAVRTDRASADEIHPGTDSEDDVQGPETSRLSSRTVREFVAHYHLERPHQGLGNLLLTPRAGPSGSGDVVADERLGGLLRSYRRAA